MAAAPPIPVSAAAGAAGGKTGDPRFAQDPVVAATKRCIELNRALFTAVTRQMAAVNRELKRNREDADDVDARAKSAKSAKKSKHGEGGRWRAGRPYFARADGSRPPPNADAVRHRPALRRMRAVYQAKEWTKREDEKLAKAIRSQIYKHELDEINKKYHQQVANYKMKRRRETDLLQAKEHSQAGQREVEARVTPEKGKHEWLDWSEIAAKVGSDPPRTKSDCQIRWWHWVHPAILRSRFTTAEDAAILKHAKADGAYADWEALAKRLQGRSVIQLLSRYQSSLNPQMIKHRWTDSEDKLLVTLVKKHGEGNWTKISAQIPGRLSQQCLHRWQQTLKLRQSDNKLVKGKWRPDEVERLQAAVDQYGEPNWSKIAKMVETRTGPQCRDRYKNIEAPGLNRSTWTPAEDRLLLKAVDHIKVGHWSEVASYMKQQSGTNRTDGACLRRYKKLTPDYENTVERKRQQGTMLMQNFVHRDKARARIAPGDAQMDRISNEVAQEPLMPGRGVDKADVKRHLRKYRVKDLQQVLKKRNIQYSGKKEVLLERLYHCIMNPPTQTASGGAGPGRARAVEARAGAGATPAGAGARRTTTVSDGPAAPADLAETEHDLPPPPPPEGVQGPPPLPGQSPARRSSGRQRRRSTRLF